MIVASTPCLGKKLEVMEKHKSIVRQHQFYKVEMVSIVEQDKCLEELEE